jgi:hypothetical protein
MTHKLRYLNIGCGAKVHPQWHNADLVPGAPGVIRMDASKPLPFADACMVAIYSSAMIEHLSRRSVPILLGECFRILAAGGILRIGVPDFERACRVYLETLESACAGIAGAEWDHEWMITEIVDQSARDVSGGEMAAILSREKMPNLPFVLKRIGVDGETLRASMRQSAIKCASAARPRRSLRSWIKSILLRRLTGCTQEEIAVGRFRLRGEVHRWAYDRYNISSLLKQAGFVEITLQDPYRSQIPDWQSFFLDVTADGRALKPDILYIEATKPIQQLTGGEGSHGRRVDSGEK